jgi:hypothetical protein
LAEEWAEITFQQAVEGASSTNTPLMRTGIGLNVTNAFSGTRGQLSMGTTTYDILKENNAKFDLVPGLGINNLNACEAGSASNPTFYGTQTDMLLKAVWMA